MASKLLYYCIILPISYLPFRLLYGISDLIYFILYKLIAYRTSVVRKNLKNSFPEKSEEDIKQIESRFYAHLCDLIVESIKAFTISEKEVKKRMINRNADLINRYTQMGKQVVMVGGHYGNWELYAIGIGMDLEAQSIALYTPLKNQFFDEKIKQSRSKYGLEMLSIHQIKSKLDKSDKELYAVIFGADQSPRKSQRAYWMKFLNQETAVQFGTEKFATEREAAVVFGNIYKIKRGYYEVKYQLICEDASKMDYGDITKSHVKLLENDIRKQPEYWLWSHKRWKHSRPEEEPLN